MIYIVKYFYQTFLLPPGIIITGTLLLAFRIRKKHGKFAGVLLAMAILFYLISIPAISGMLINSLERRYIPPEQVSGDVIIMLGGGSTMDTPNVNGLGHLSGSSANRLLTSAQLYNKLGVPIIISGGQVFESTGNEAEIGKLILEGIGVPPYMVIVEGRSLNTTQNARYTKEIIEKEGFKKPILVTSAFHMDRSVHQFNKVGVNVIPYPTDYRGNIKRTMILNDFIPTSDAISGFSAAIKEYIGILASSWY